MRSVYCVITSHRPPLPPTPTNHQPRQFSSALGGDCRAGGNDERSSHMVFHFREHRKSTSLVSCGCCCTCDSRVEWHRRRCDPYLDSCFDPCCGPYRGRRAKG